MKPGVETLKREEYPILPFSRPLGRFLHVKSHLDLDSEHIPVILGPFLVGRVRQKFSVSKYSLSFDLLVLEGLLNTRSMLHCDSGRDFILSFVIEINRFPVSLRNLRKII